MLNLPPGIAKQAQPLLEKMMQQMDLSPEQMEMMMVDMQMMVEQLPPGIFLQLLRLMLQPEMEDMMMLHQEMHQGTLIQQTPGQILALVRGLVL